MISPFATSRAGGERDALLPAAALLRSSSLTRISWSRRALTPASRRFKLAVKRFGRLGSALRRVAKWLKSKGKGRASRV